MKINEIITEMTSAGGIAAVSAPIGGTIKREPSPTYTKYNSKKKKPKKVIVGKGIY